MATKALVVDPLWKWSGKLNPQSRNLLNEAVRRNVEYAGFVAWARLRDHSLSADLMESALDPVVSFVVLCTTLPDQKKVTLRLRSQIHRVATQKAKKLRLEEPSGLLSELAGISKGVTFDISQTLLIDRICAELSPRAREVADGIRQGYSWREIARSLGIAESAVRQSFRREVDAALLKTRKPVPAPNSERLKPTLRARG